MTLRQLAYLIAIVEEGSFTRAAEKLAVAQPSLSQQVKALEAELGAPLLERLPRGIRLTAAGRAMLPEARAAVGHSQRAERAVRNVTGLAAGELELATVTSIAYGVLPPPLQQWHELYPNTTVRLREFHHSHLLEEAVQAGVGDLAVGPQPADWAGQTVDLGVEEFVVVLPRSDPLAATNDRLPLEALADRNWVTFGAEHGLSAFVNDACARVGFVPKSTAVTGQVAAAPHLSAAGLGVTMVPWNVVPRGLDAGVRHLRPPILRRLVAYTRESWSPGAQAFVAVLRGRELHRIARVMSVEK